MERESYIFYRNWWNAFRNMPNEMRLEAYDGIMQYAFDNNLEGVSVLAKCFIEIARPVIEKDREKYETICSRNRENGKNGGRPKKEKKENPENPLGFFGFNDKTQQNPTKPYNDNDNDNDNNNIESIDSLSVSTDSGDRVSYIEIVDFYNNSVGGHNLPKCSKLTEKRKAAIKARLTEFGKEKVFEAITRVVNSSFCNGRNDRNWKADFDFVFNPNKMACILEGKYDDERISYGKSTISNEQRIRSVGENALRDIFAEMEDLRRTERDNA